MGTLVERLHHTVERNPDSEAIVHGENRVSYSKLWDQVSAIADFFRSHGLKPGDRIAILLPNSIEYVATYYGVLCAGGIVVPLNTAVKYKDLLNWLSHSQSLWCVAAGVNRELKKAVQSIDTHLKVVLAGKVMAIWEEEDYYPWDHITESGSRDCSVPDISQEVASIIYTSGTTGAPKGVTLSHKNLDVNVQSILEYLGIDKSDSVMNVLPFFYSYGNSVLHTHLAVGGRLVLENSLMYPAVVMEKMVSEKVTGFSGVASTYALLMSRTKLEEYDLSALRYMTQAGGPMPEVQIKKLCSLIPHARFFVMYGQTEATARLSYLPPDMLESKMGSAGIAIPEVELDIRDKQGCTVAQGEIGEIWARGDNIMTGYWRDPEATQKVVQDGWLSTGDLAYFDNDGYMYIKGRNVDMIKSGANRINPGEIEQVISEVPGVAEVAAVGVPDEIMGQLIKVIIVAEDGIAVDKRDVIRYCQENLAIYKIPKYIEFISELPKTASGKVKRHVLTSNL